MEEEESDSTQQWTGEDGEMDDGGSESEEEGLSTSPWRARKTVTRRLRRKQKGTSHRARVSRQTSQPGTPHLGVHPPGVRLRGTRLPGVRLHGTRLPSMRHPVTRPRISRHPGTSRTHASQRRNLLPRRTGATLTQHPLPTWGAYV